VYQRLGQRTAARAMYEEQVATLSALGDRSSEARVLNNLADLLLEEGELEAAWNRSSRALVLHRQIGEAAGIAEAEGMRGQILALRGDLPGAQRELEAAVAGLDALGSKLPAARQRIALARVLVDAGRPADAEAMAQEALAALGAQPSPEDEVEARTVRAAAALARGRNDIATAEIRRTVAALGRCENRTVRLQAKVVTARVHAAAGRQPEALLDLRAAQEEAESIGLRPLVFEARLARAMILDANRGAAGGDDLAAVAREAAAAGFGGIASRARNAGVSSPRGPA
jgi:tetratricopeptide (TPR) repeat protein